MLISKNGEPCQSIDCHDRAFLYGDGFFTTIKIQHGKALLWPRHLARLKKCADQLFFSMNFDQLEQYMQRVLADYLNSSDGNAVFKIIVSRGVGQRGYLAPQQPADIYFQVLPYIERPELDAPQGIETGVLGLSMGHVMPQLAGLKTLNRLEQVVLRQALAATPWQEALVSDVSGNLIEGVYSNCFIYLDGRWHTPLLDQAGIEGVLRAEVLAQMNQLGLNPHVCHIPCAVLDRVEALFFCNALTGIVPVGVLNDRPLNIQIVQQLQQQLLLS